MNKKEKTHFSVATPFLEKSVRKKDENEHFETLAGPYKIQTKRKQKKIFL